MELREISREEHEMILNLFILKMQYELYFNFIDWDNGEYEELIKVSDIILLKDLIPMDEICIIEKQLDNFSECFYLAKKPEYIEKKFNYIKEV